MFFSTLSSFFNTAPLTTWILIGLGLVVIVCLILIGVLHNRIRRLLGTNATTIEEHLAELRAAQKTIQQFNRHVEEHLVLVEKRLRNSVQAVETVRFNAFKGDGTGGGQSFATTLLTEEGNGVVISSMYARDHVSIFAKPIQGLKPSFELSTEEKISFDTAQKKVASLTS